jgi:hypothetical protein
VSWMSHVTERSPGSSLVPLPAMTRSDGADRHSGWVRNCKESASDADSLLKRNSATEHTDSEVPATECRGAQHRHRHLRQPHSLEKLRVNNFAERIERRDPIRVAECRPGGLNADGGDRWRKVVQEVS